MNALDVLEEAQDAPTNALEVLQTASLGFTSAFNGSYSIGQEVDLTWNSPYELTSLEVWQGPNGAGSYAVDTLAVNLTQSETSFVWNATALDGGRLNAPFYFRLQKGDLPNDCGECMASSSTFEVEDPSAPADTSTSSLAATPTASIANSSSTPSAEAAEASSSPSAVSSGSHEISQGTKIGIGVGVGVGFAVVVTLIAFILLCLKRRQKKQNAALREDERQRNIRMAEEAEKPPAGRYSSGAESWLTKSSGKTKSYHDPFEFQNEDGTMKPGWEKLFGKNGVPQRSRSGRLLFGRD